jgi:hypothetical protein
MDNRAQRYNCGKRYLREIEPWEYKTPWWLWAYLAAVVYLFFS